MIKRVMGMLAMLLCLFSLQAQEMPKLPLNPAVKHGTLPNGLNYYIMHNEEPKGRANFYIAQKVGSTLENANQLGLAHFLEHMAFNGSKNLPGKMMLEYLQSKGVRFGADINAYTGFDETVYRINNVNANDEALMDTVLLVLHDWSGYLSLEDDEIDAERGVIQGEYLSRTDAQSRMMDKFLPILYEEQQYRQMPIGTMDVVMHFPYDALRDYYHKWYRPDQQGIVIVGDFDVDAMEKKVIALMSEIPMPENAAERTYPSVSDNKELIYASHADPEAQNMLIRFFIKMEKTPFEERSGLDYWLEKSIVETLIEKMIDGRLTELSQKPDCAFAYAGVGFTDYMVSKTKGSFMVAVVPKDDPQAAFAEAFGEVVRACRTGFTDSELARAKEELRASYEKRYNERDKTNSDALAQGIIRYFIDNEPNPGIEVDWQLIQQFLPMIPVQAINEGLKDIISPENQVYTILVPQALEGAIPSKEAVEQLIAGTMSKEYEAFVDDVLDQPLIAKMPKKGKVKKIEEVPEFGATKLTLSNGATVLVKTTDFAADQILFSATANFGKLAYEFDKADDLRLAAAAFECSKLGAFNTTQLSKALAGKQIGSEYELENNTVGLSGSSTVKDLETLMQVIYLQFTQVGADPEAYQALVNQLTAILANQETTPDYQFSKMLAETRFPDNPHMTQLKHEDIAKADYDRMLKYAKESLSNAADYDFIFVGNVDVATLTPLLEQYIASLPGNVKKAGARKNAKLTGLLGLKENKRDMPMETPMVKEFVMLNGADVPYSLANSVQMKFLGQILDIVYTRTLREEIGGTYSPSAFASLSPRTGEWTIGWLYDTNAGQLQEMEERADKELLDLLEKGATAEDFNKVKEQALNQFQLSTKKNQYWKSVLENYALLGIDGYSEYEKTVNGITLDSFNAFLKTLDATKHRMKVQLNGTAK